MFKIVGIFTNLDRDIGLNTTKGLINIFKKNNIKYLLHEKVKGVLPEPEYFNFDEAAKIDVIVSIGGDGTVLGLTDYCVKNDLPLIGVNKGRLGFLNEIEPANLESIADIIKGKYYLDKRQLLEVKACGKTFYALNEALVYRNYESKIIILDVRVDGQLVDRYCCDGFIVSTPTGSTAYSLSAGGPILSPNARANVLTPLNSHSIRTKPIVVCNEDKVVMTLVKPEAGAEILIDGDKICDVRAGEPVEVCGCDLYMKFLRKTNDFYSKLLYKLNILGTTENL